MTEGQDISAWLRTHKTRFVNALQSADSAREWTVVMGNEAGDLDSLASAIAFAYLSSTPSNLYFPLVQTPRAELRLRPENTYALEHSGIDPAGLLCGDEVPNPHSKWAGRVKGWILVDHYELDSESFGTAGKVLGILDHHEPTSPVSSDGLSPFRIEPVGSCSSLVALHFLDKKRTVPAPVADLLLAAIAIDTGLKSSDDGGKLSSKDRKAVDGLLETSVKLNLPHGIVNMLSTHKSSPYAAFEKKLQKVKNDMTPFSTSDLLLRDFKSYSYPGKQATTASGPKFKWGLASVPLALADWVERPSNSWTQLGKDAEAFMRSRNLEVLGILTSFKPKHGEKGRELVLLISPTADAKCKTLLDGVQASERLRLSSISVEEWAVDDVAVRRRVWRQGATDATRKQVQPEVERALRVACNAA